MKATNIYLLPSLCAAGVGPKNDCGIYLMASSPFHVFIIDDEFKRVQTEK